MRIWLITVGEPLPTDPGEPRLLRTGELATALAGAGHNVLWWTSTFDHYRKVQRSQDTQEVSVGGYRIRMLKSTGYGRNLSPRRFLEHMGVAREFLKTAPKEPTPDVILCSLPTIELARACVRYGEERRVPVLLDIRDLWPDVFEHLLPAGLRWVPRLALSWLYRAASYSLRKADGLVALSQAYLEWGLQRAGRDTRWQDKVIPVGFRPPSDISSAEMSAAEATLLGMGVRPDKKICWFAGSFSRQFDWSPVLRGARKLEADGSDDVQFVLCGDGDHLQKVQEAAGDLRNVIFTGWVGRAELAWLRERAAIGLQPYVSTATVGLANKLFEYLSAGVAILSSLKGENERLLADNACGLTYDPTRPGDFGEKLSTLLHDDERREAMGERGLALFRSRFQADFLHEQFSRHLENVAGEPSRATSK